MFIYFWTQFFFLELLTICCYNVLEVAFMNNLAFYRKKKGVSQQAVADYLGITRQAYWNYENAKREADYETLIKLAAFFETSIENLISEKEPHVQKETITLDDFTYAFYQETKDLSEEAKEQLLTMAKLLNGTLPKKKE